MLEACWRHQQACQLPALRSGHVQSCSYSKPDPIMHDITAEVWAALPPGLTSLVTPGVSGFHQSVVASPHPTWQQHSSLHTLRIILYFLYIQKLCLLLAAAPSLADMFEPGRTLLLKDQHDIWRHTRAVSFDRTSEGGAQICHQRRQRERGWCLQDVCQSSSSPRAPQCRSLRPLLQPCSLSLALLCYTSCYYCAEADLSQLSRVFTSVRELISQTWSWMVRTVLP